MSEEKKRAHVGYADVEKNHGDNARSVYREIAEISGGDTDPNHAGGISLAGLPDGKLNRIEKLLAADAGDETDAKTAGKTTPAKTK